MTLDAETIVRLLGLSPHPEGGYYRETFRDPAPDGGRGAVTTIHFLLAAGQRSAWHRVDAIEIWHYHGGAPLALDVVAEGRGRERHVLGMDLAAGERPHVVVPGHAWQSAESLGAWTLVGCAVAPAFRFSGFELAPPGWEP